MSENTNNEDTTSPASLAADETVIPTDSAEKLVKAVAELKDKKAEAAEEADAIALPKEPETKPGLGFVADGVMGSTEVPKAVKKAPVAKETKQDTVAIHSTRNVSWSGVGSVKIGYNIVSKAAAELWLKRGHIRLATPEEVAQEYGK